MSFGTGMGDAFAAVPAQQPREHVSASVAAGPGVRLQVDNVCPAHQASSDECQCDLDLAGFVLDGLGARCADRPGLTALSRVLGTAGIVAAGRSAVRSSNSSASRTVRGSAATLADGSGPDMAVNGITSRGTVTRLRSDVPVSGRLLRQSVKSYAKG